MTTPDCSPIVDWHVLRDPVKISEDRAVKLSNHFLNTSNGEYVLNNREIQPAEGRPIYCASVTTIEAEGDYFEFANIQHAFGAVLGFFLLLISQF